MDNPQHLSDEDRDNLSAYLDGELDQNSARALEAKLNIDPGVRLEADTLRRTWDMLDYLPRPEPSPNFTHRTLERLTAQQARRQGLRGWRPWLRGLGWAAALVLASAFGFAAMSFLGLRQQQGVTDQRLVRDLRVIENVILYEHVDDLDFLHKLANPNDPDLFGEDNHGS